MPIVSWPVEDRRPKIPNCISAFRSVMRVEQIGKFPSSEKAFRKSWGRVKLIWYRPGYPGAGPKYNTSGYTVEWAANAMPEAGLMYGKLVLFAMPSPVKYTE